MVFYAQATSTVISGSKNLGAVGRLGQAFKVRTVRDSAWKAVSSDSIGVMSFAHCLVPWFVDSAQTLRALCCFRFFHSFRCPRTWLIRWEWRSDWKNLSCEWCLVNTFKQQTLHHLIYSFEHLMASAFVIRLLYWHMIVFHHFDCYIYVWLI